jgi:hypothetical protein
VIDSSPVKMNLRNSVASRRLDEIPETLETQPQLSVHLTEAAHRTVSETEQLCTLLQFVSTEIWAPIAYFCQHNIYLNMIYER